MCTQRSRRTSYPEHTYRALGRISEGVADEGIDALLHRAAFENHTATNGHVERLHTFERRAEATRTRSKIAPIT